MPLRPKRNIAGLKSVTHGGIDYAEFAAMGINPAEIIDFSVSTNPFMPPPGIREIINSSPFDKYPDSGCTEFRKRLAEKLQISPEYILAGSGSTELIRLIAMTYFRQNDRVLRLEPTYGSYELVSRIAGARRLVYRATEDSGFTPDIKEVTRVIEKYRPRAVFICNPNNPTGNYLTRAAVDEVVNVMGDGLLILDEAYVSFVQKNWNSLELIERGNVIVLRSMTKDYGLPGLRLGYAVARREISADLRRVLPPWNVNSIAQQVGVAVLEDDDSLNESLDRVREAKDYLIDAFTRLGLSVIPSEANYFLVKAGNASNLRSELLRRGILVRDCTSFGLPGHIRVAPRTLSQCENFVKTMRNIMESVI